MTLEKYYLKAHSNENCRNVVTAEEFGNLQASIIEFFQGFEAARAVGHGDSFAFIVTVETIKNVDRTAHPVAVTGGIKGVEEIFFRQIFHADDLIVVDQRRSPSAVTHATLEFS